WPPVRAGRPPCRTAGPRPAWPESCWIRRRCTRKPPAGPASWWPAPRPRRRPWWRPPTPSGPRCWRKPAAKGIRPARRKGAGPVRGEAAARLDALAAVVNEVGRVRDELAARYEDDIVELALAVAARIVRRESALGPDTVRTLLRETLPRTGGATNIKIVLHPED